MDAFHLIRHGVVDSTSERAFAALADGSAEHGDVHVATGQSAGRGRQGRVWLSAEGEGLYASVVLALTGAHAIKAGMPSPVALSMACGLAVLDAVRALGLSTARLDWPNDLVTPGPAKVAGILVESRGGGPPDMCVLGFGLNVLQTAFPPDLEAERAVTSLAREGITASVEEALGALLVALPGRLDQASADPTATGGDYLAATGLGRAAVRVIHGQAESTGTIQRMDPSEGLVLATGAGKHEVIELAHVRSVAATL